MIRLLTEKDRERVIEYLNRNHMETTFLIGNVLEFGLDNNSDIRRCADYYGYFQGEALKGILPFYNLGSCIPHFEVDEAREEFIRIMREKDYKFLLGMKRFIEPLYNGVKDCKKTIEYSEDSYFVNNSFKPFYINGAEFKTPDEIEIERAVEFTIHANEDGFGNVNSREDTIKSLRQRAGEEDFLYMIVDGKIVAQACIQTFTDRINQIGGVYTLREERGNGYCKAIVSYICQRIVDRGKIPTLMVTKKNTPAVRAYTSLGFGFYDDYLIIKFE